MPIDLATFAKINDAEFVTIEIIDLNEIRKASTRENIV